ncbi:MAG TPA: hypothetical protein DCP91_08490, partial [Eggerthellaceae bacterium]|nr:hypothetical protein [Eggerthellaceae bacterium]
MLLFLGYRAGCQVQRSLRIGDFVQRGAFLGSCSLGSFDGLGQGSLCLVAGTGGVGGLGGIDGGLQVVGRRGQLGGLFGCGLLRFGS